MKVINDTIAVKVKAPQGCDQIHPSRASGVRGQGAPQGLRNPHQHLDAGGAPYVSSLRMDQAKNVEEYADAASYNLLPGRNYIWGDRDNHIYYTADRPRAAPAQLVGAVPGAGRWPL